MKRLINLHTLLIAILLVFNVQAADKISIYTTNYPLKYFAERIAGEHANVVLPIPPEVDPAFWVPEIEIIIQYQTADLIFVNGASYEKWIHKVSLPQHTLIDTSSSFKDSLITIEEMTNHSHGFDGEHTHSGTAFTTWLDFSLAAKQANSVYTTLIQRYPQFNRDLEYNFKRLEDELMALDQQLTEIVNKNEDVLILASHPVYQYLQHRYKLNIESVLWEPETLPSNKEWQALTNILETHSSNWMIWEKAPISKTVNKLIQHGIASVVVNPCANVPNEGDFMSVMVNNLQNLSEIFK